MKKHMSNDSPKKFRLKRVFDFSLSISMIIICSPLFALIILLLLLENIACGRSAFSIFFLDLRISAGKEFRLIKFNIFLPSAIIAHRQPDGIIHTKSIENDDQNLSFIGRFLKNVYFDELPQLFNILKGDISFVGPRPVNKQVYEKRLHLGQQNNLLVKGGLTGIFQSQKGHAKKGQYELDMEYITFCQNNNAWKILLFDLKIMLSTVRVIFEAKGI